MQEGKFEHLAVAVGHKVDVPDVEVVANTVVEVDVVLLEDWSHLSGAVPGRIHLAEVYCSYLGKTDCNCWEEPAHIRSDVGHTHSQVAS